MPKLVPDEVKEKAIALYVQGLSLAQINDRLGVSGASVTSWVRSAGFAVRTKSESTKMAFREGRMKRGGQSGPLSHSWRGGRIVSPSTGYVLLKMPEHHRANKIGYVPEHVVVAEKTIGRPLARDEVVHHINHIRDDNRPENLQVMTDREHRSLHSKLRWQDKSKPFRRGLKTA
jgi:hypothetical protein